MLLMCFATQLFFDYRYDDEMDNDLIVKSAHKPVWIKRGKASSKSTNIKAAKKNAV